MGEAHGMHRKCILVLIWTILPSDGGRKNEIHENGEELASRPIKNIPRLAFYENGKARDHPDRAQWL